MWTIQRRIELLRAEQALLEYDLSRGSTFRSFRRLRQMERLQSEIRRLEVEMLTLRSGGSRGYGGYMLR
jgi:hypothetical protein